MRNAVYRAFGKVNLALRVLGRRQDGYHEVSTLMVPVHLHDVLTFVKKQEGLSVICPGLLALPPEKNLAFRAARAVLDASGEPFGLEITIEKSIPSGSGMGGGSSDAAATFLAANRMLPLQRRFDFGSLMRAAAGLGADIPFFLGCNSSPPSWRAALCTGIGDKVEPLSGVVAGTFWLVIAIPEFQVNTAQAYLDWDEGGGAGAGGTGAAVEKAALSGLISGDPEELAAGLSNDLEGPVSRRYPRILAVKERLVECGAAGASMTGSGSAVFGVCKSQEHAAAVKDKIMESSRDLGLAGAIVTRTGV